MKVYNEEDYLMLSGIQHFYYSERQWCLIHLEQQWQDNRYTIEGQILHEKADNPYLKEKRKDTFISRAIPVSSSRLGLSGVVDVVEFKRDDKNGVVVYGKEGLWRPVIVEFKRGKPKKDSRDIVQLVAQVMCLEEAFDTQIDVSYIYYGQTNKRQEVVITDDLRREVIELADEMHRVYDAQENVGLEEDPADKGDSLRDISLSYALKPDFDVEDYLFTNADEELV